MPLQRVEKISAVDQICDSVKQSIADGSLSPGEKLMSEGQLAEIFGVNRFTVRLALQKLSTLGLIETRVGEGSFVKTASLKQYVKEMWVLWGKNIPSKDIARMRYLIETDSIVLAIERAAPEECQVLGEYLQRYSDLLSKVDGDSDEQTIWDLIKADLDFHMQIVQMSHNQLYVEVYIMIRELVKGHIRGRINAVKESAKKGKSSEDTMHRYAYEAIVNHNVEAGKRYGDLMKS